MEEVRGDQTKRNRIYVAYVLRGALDPDEITATVGVEPTRTWREGDPAGFKGRSRFRDSGWEVQSRSDETTYVEDHVHAVFEVLRPGWQELAELGRRYDAYLDCALYIYETGAPALVLEADDVAALAELNCGISVDLYCLNWEAVQAENDAYRRDRERRKMEEIGGLDGEST
jgi:hypothetical protein